MMPRFINNPQAFVEGKPTPFNHQRVYMTKKVMHQGMAIEAYNRSYHFLGHIILTDFAAFAERERCTDSWDNYTGGNVNDDGSPRVGHAQWWEARQSRQPAHDAAYESEARLRDMEGTGTYEGPVSWP